MFYKEFPYPTRVYCLQWQLFNNIGFRNFLNHCVEFCLHVQVMQGYLKQVTINFIIDLSRKPQKSPPPYQNPYKVFDVLSFSWVINTEFPKAVFMLSQFLYLSVIRGHRCVLRNILHVLRNILLVLKNIHSGHR